MVARVPVVHCTRFVFFVCGVDGGHKNQHHPFHPVPGGPGVRRAPTKRSERSHRTEPTDTYNVVRVQCTYRPDYVMLSWTMWGDPYSDITDIAEHRQVLGDYDRPVIFLPVR